MGARIPAMTVPELKLAAPLGATKAPPFASHWQWLTAAMTPLYVAVFVYALMLCLGGRLLGDPDTYFHIAAGNWIWAHRAVPGTDPFSATMTNMPWIAHEWLSELILAAAYDSGGWVGVVATTAAALATTYFLLARYLGHILSTVATLLALIPSFLLASPHMLARPHVLAMPLLVAWIAALETARTEKRTPSYRWLPIMTLWANLHGGFVIGLALIGFYALEAIVIAPDFPRRWHAARQWSAFLLGAGLAALLTPYGIKGPLFALHLSSLTFSLSVVNEWRGTDFSQFQPLELWLLALLALGFGLRLRLPLIKLMLLLGLIHLALVHRRNTELLALIGPILLAEPVTEALRETASHARLQGPPARYHAAGAFALVFATALVSWHGIAHDDQRVAPTHAIAAAFAAGVTGPVLNAYGFGGYLVFAGIPPFVDGRVDLYGDAFMHDYVDAVSAKEQALSTALERYHIDWTLLEPQMAAVTELDHLPGWERVYADASAVVHRRVSETASGRPAPP
jgi:hypothetical protein